MSSSDETKNDKLTTSGSSKSPGIMSILNGEEFFSEYNNLAEYLIYGAKPGLKYILEMLKATSDITITHDDAGDTLTLSHTHKFTAGTASGSPNGNFVPNGTIVIPTITWDGNGHVSAKGTTTLNIPATFPPPIATTNTLGGVKQGTNVTIDPTGILSVATASTSVQGIVKLVDSVASTSKTDAATANSVKVALDTAKKYTDDAKSALTDSSVQISLLTDSEDMAWSVGEEENTISVSHTHTIAAGTASGQATGTIANGGTIAIPSISYDKHGHISSKTITTVTLTKFTASKGITLSGANFQHSNNITAGTISGTATGNVANGGKIQIPSITFDAQGHITSTTTTTVTLTAYTGTAGIQVSGNTISHTNSIEAATAAGSANNTAVANGGSFAIPTITYDAQGHITAKGTNTIKMTAFTGTAGITVTGNSIAHSNAVDASTASGSANGTAVANGGSFVIPTVTYDAQGHITAKGSATIKITAFTGSKGITVSGNAITHTNAVTGATTASTATGTLGNGGKFIVPIVTYDDQGHITESSSSTITLPTYSANKGITLSGLAFGHTNNITAGKAQGSATATLGVGGSFTIPVINYDANGHITSTSTTTITLPKDADTVDGYHVCSASSGSAGVWGRIPRVGSSDGVMEVGKFIDFHSTSDGTTDYDARITASTSGLTLSGTTTGTFSGNLTGKASTAGTADKVAHKLTIQSNGTTVGTFDGSAAVTANITAANVGASPSNHNHDTVYVKLAGSTMTGPLKSSYTTGTYLAGAQGNALLASTAAAKAYVTFLRYPSTNGAMVVSGHNDTLIVGYMSNTKISAGTNGLDKTLTLLNEAGNSSFPGTVTASAFNGNASSATKVGHALTIQGNGTTLKTFDGSAAQTVNITAANVGAAASSHNHDSVYVKPADFVINATAPATGRTYMWFKVIRKE